MPRPDAIGLKSSGLVTALLENPKDGLREVVWHVHQRSKACHAHPHGVILRLALRRVGDFNPAVNIEAHDYLNCDALAR
jgi:hypothetical protein